MPIISASRRTDLPAFYSKWFLNRIRAGFCHVLAPYGGGVRRVELNAEASPLIVFWTRNPRPIERELDFLDAEGYLYYFTFTITGYPRTLEASAPPPETATAAFRRLSDRLGPERVIWRFDPIILTDTIDEAAIRDNFRRIAEKVCGATTSCYFSFVDYYRKTEQNLAAITKEYGTQFIDPSLDQKKKLAAELAEIADGYGLTLSACCEQELVGAAVAGGSCVDPKLIRKLLAAKPFALTRPGVEPPSLKPAPTRPGCGCVRSVDIGAYDLCPAGCRYCYAVSKTAVAKSRRAEHNPSDTIIYRPKSLRGFDLDRSDK